ncbi:MAG TPA: hypothetical protein VJ246_02430 [Patescibacteria group bacterium]|nr:hypothetical protein [Patescibacteria group bacterium]
MSTAIGEGVYYTEQVHPGFQSDVFYPSLQMLMRGQILSQYAQQVAPNLDGRGRRHIDTTIEKIRAIIPLLRQETGDMETAMYRLLTDYDDHLRSMLSEAGYAKAAPYMRKHAFQPIEGHEYEHETRYASDGTPIDMAIDVTPSEIEKREKKQRKKHEDQDWTISCITAAYARFLLDQLIDGSHWALTRIYASPDDYPQVKSKPRSFPHSLLSILAFGASHQFCVFEPLDYIPGSIQFEKGGVFKKTWETP